MKNDSAWRCTRVALLLFCGLVLASGADRATAQSLGDVDQLEMLQTGIAGVAEQVAPTVVAIRAEKRVVRLQPQSRAEGGSATESGQPAAREERYPVVGSGIIIRSDGLIVTNEHVIDQADPQDIVCTLSNGDSYTVKAVTSDHFSDLAVLRIEAQDLPEARLGDAKTVRQGHFAIALGNPFGLAAEGKPAMSFGIISALGRPLTRQLSPLDIDERYYGNLIETDARINLGNSGGPLLNIRGEVIGITTAVSSRSGGNEGVGYAIPMDGRTKSIIAQLARGEEVEYGYLGIRMEAPTAEDRRLAGAPPGIGALIREIVTNTAAAQSDLRIGDLVVSFDGEPVQNVDQLIRMVGAARVGASVQVTLFRDGMKQTIHVTPGRRSVIPGVNYQLPVRWRGLTLADITPELRDRYAIGAETKGVVITAVDQAVLEQVQAALRDEIQEGLVANEVNGIAIDSIYEFKKQIAKLEGPARVSLQAKDLAFEVMLPPEIAAE